MSIASSGELSSGYNSCHSNEAYDGNAHVKSSKKPNIPAAKDVVEIEDDNGVYVNG